MKETKSNINNLDEHQAGNDCSEEAVASPRRLLSENEQLSDVLDLLLSYIKGGCSLAEAESLQQMIYKFIANMKAREALIDALLN